MTLYRMRDVRVRHPDGTVVVVPDVAIDAGDRVALVGPNGAGKTTALRVLARLEHPAHGVAAAVSGRDVAFVAQRPFLFRGSVEANLRIALRARGVPRTERAARARAALEALGAAHLAGRDRAALSAGELQRVALARALAVRPRVLLLDEPLGPLDEDGAARLATLLASLDGVTVVAAAPDVDGIPFRDGCRLVRVGG